MKIKIKSKYSINQIFYRDLRSKEKYLTGNIVRSYLFS
jgi:hypothetical protein